MNLTHAVCLVALLSGCHRAASPAASSSGGDEAAKRLASYKANQEGKPCPSFAADGEVVVGDFAFRFGTPLVVEPETRLPWIGDSDERRAFSRRRKALVIPTQVKNLAPVAQYNPNVFGLVTTDGTINRQQWYHNAKLWAQANHVVQTPDVIKPGVWVTTILLFAVEEPLTVDEAPSLDPLLIYMAHATTVRDLGGNRRRVLVRHAVAALAPTDTGAPLRH